jgi:hypothetical protein
MSKVKTQNKTGVLIRVCFDSWVHPFSTTPPTIIYTSSTGKGCQLQALEIIRKVGRALWRTGELQCKHTSPSCIYVRKLCSSYRLPLFHFLSNVIYVCTSDRGPTLRLPSFLFKVGLMRGLGRWGKSQCSVSRKKSKGINSLVLNKVFLKDF